MNLEQSNISSSKENYIEYLSAKETLVCNIRLAREFIEESCGITLTTIELVGLRRIAEKTMKDIINDERGRSREEDNDQIDPKKEIPVRFFQCFYDLDALDVKGLYSQNDHETFKMYFRACQASLHLP